MMRGDPFRGMRIHIFIISAWTVVFLAAVLWFGVRSGYRVGVAECGQSVEISE